MATPTGKLIRNPQVLNAMGTSTTAAPSQQAVATAVADAKKAGTDAQSTANTANSTANAAVADAATAYGKAVAAQTAADNANSNANGRVPSGRKVNGKALTADISLTAADVEALTQSTADGRYMLKTDSAGVTLGAVEKVSRGVSGGPNAISQNHALMGLLLGVDTVNKPDAQQYSNSSGTSIPENSVIVAIGKDPGKNGDGRVYMKFRRITGGI